MEMWERCMERWKKNQPADGDVGEVHGEQQMNNLKLPIRIQKKAIDGILQYFRDLGYTITEKQCDEGRRAYMTNAPSWGKLTPVIECLKTRGKAEECWFYIRLKTQDECQTF